MTSLLLLVSIEAPSILAEVPPSPPDASRGRIPKAGPAGRTLGADLALVLAEHESWRAAGSSGDSRGGFRTSRRLVPIVDGHVVIDAVASGSAESLRAELDRLGLRGGAVYGRIVSGRLPLAALREAASLPTLSFVRPAVARTSAGSVTSQGDAATRADQGRLSFAVDGTGITVGILSNTFDCAGTGLGTDLASGDLPAGTVILDDGGCPGDDEGRAIAQIVHDLAPGAEIVFHTARNGQAAFAAGILELAGETGADILVDDLYYLAEPMFQDGIIAQAVDTVVGSGVPHFSAAGNRGRSSYEEAYRPSGIPVLFDGDAHDFDPGPGVDVFQSISIPVEGEIILSLQWDSPFFSVSGPPGSPNDVDICLMDDPPTVLIECGQDLNTGLDPVELLSFFNDGAFGTEFNLVIELFEGPAPGLIKYILFEDGVANEYGTSSGTIFGHANAAGAEAVGAACYFETPEFGTTPAVLELSSTVGGTPIFFDLAGVRLSSPDLRSQPGLVGPDGTNNTFFGTDISDPGDRSDQDHLPNFFGTSAAVAHAAGLAALLLDRNGALGADDVYGALEATADDMDDPSTGGFDTGFDFATGFGLCVADAALGAVPECGNGATEPPEECDDANPVDDDSCGNDCLANVCGDGVVHLNNGEECDDGNAFDDDFCRNDCGRNFCGDGRFTNFSADLLINGDFETGALDGWEVTDLGAGTFVISTPGAPTPTGAFATSGNPGGGLYYAVTAQVDAGTHALEQPFTVPPTANRLMLSFEMFVNDQSGLGPIIDPIGLDHTGPPNQHVRVDLLAAGSGAFDTGSGVLSNLYLGVDPGPTPNPYLSYLIDLLDVTAPGATYDLRFAEVDNQFFLHLGVDNVSVTASLLEECDDGNTTDGDGCSAVCALEGCAPPDEVTGVHLLADGSTIGWDSGTGDSYDVVRSDGLPLGPGNPGTEACIASASPGDTASDTATPPTGSAFHYVVRARDGCGAGSYGFSSSTTERSTTTCP